MVQLRPPGEVDSQYFWFHQISDSDCVNEAVPQFFPSETHPITEHPPVAVPWRHTCRSSLHTHCPLARLR